MRSIFCCSCRKHEHSGISAQLRESLQEVLIKTEESLLHSEIGLAPSGSLLVEINFSSECQVIAETFTSGKHPMKIVKQKGCVEANGTSVETFSKFGNFDGKTKITSTTHTIVDDSAAVLGDGVRDQRKSINEKSSIDVLLPCICSLQQAASQFTNTFQILDIPIMHIKGETQVFSCYSVRNSENNPNMCILAMYARQISSNASTPTSTSIGLLDTTIVDAVVKPKIQELESFLAEVI